MRVILLGGTRFVGRALARDLVAAGHEVLVVHRGRHEAGFGRAVRHVHVDRRRLGERRDELAGFGADAVADLSALTDADAAGALDVVGDLAPRLLVVSSVDVYRAWTSLQAGTCTDAVPLTEDSPLRDGPAPERHGPAPAGRDVDMAAYDKLAVERTYLARGAVVCRLPMVYGEHDAQRREEFVLRRVRAGRRRMPIGAGTLLVSRGYAPELARGLRYVLEAGDDVAGEGCSTCASPPAPRCGCGPSRSCGRAARTSSWSRSPRPSCPRTWR